ncbi:MAG: pyridoxal phosphate-dependent aminotransferase [Candidatus Moranbacteria bacterium]|nr:pyridoxal phosphate-dependent aminotransferase [Candidatus Moranbacteria bacterium]
MQSLKLSPIKEMEIRSSKLTGVVSLAQGIPNFKAPECIYRKTCEAIAEGRVDKYSLSPGMLEFRETIEMDLAERGIYYDFESEIIVTAGAIEAITASLLALVEPGSEVLIPDPTYTSYQEAIKNAGAAPAFFPLNEEEGWSLDVKEIEKKITSKTRAILFCNPNNPTGTVYSRDQLLKILELAQRHNLYLLSDEVYRDFVYDGLDFYSLAQFSKFRNRIIYIFSFSKSYAMTGWRVGFLAAERDLAKKILAVHDVLVTCAPVVSQWGALTALEMAGGEVEKFKSEFLERRDIVCSYLDNMTEWFEYQKPKAAYFAFPKITKKLADQLQSSKAGNQYDMKDYQKSSLSWRFALELLYEAKVALVPGVAFGLKGEDHLRICFGRSNEDIEKSFARIKDYLSRKYA